MKDSRYITGDITSTQSSDAGSLGSQKATVPVGHDDLKQETDKKLGEHTLLLQDLKEKETQFDNLLVKLNKRQDDTNNLVYLGFIFLAFTALGIAISFLNLVVDVYTFIGN